jgi:orotidine-5'-phosphate decarboxylase
VLARTSNAGSAEFQQLELKANGALVDEVARKIDAWGSESVGDCGYSDVGAVVGATHPEAAVHLRKLMPRTPFLVPGWGAQGGDAQAVRACMGRDGMGALVNSSRGVMHAYATGPLKHHGEAEWRDAVQTAARTFNEEIKALMHG